MECPGWLSDSEQHRLAGLRTAARQSLFVACRFALRQLLAADGGAPNTWSLGSCAARAPWVERDGGRVDLSPVPWLSLSHSGGWIACAKAPVAVGVDLEVQAADRQRDVQALAALVCAPSELDWVLSHPTETQQQCFLQLWCLKEAYFKCLGTGLDLARIRHSAWHVRHGDSTPDVPVVARAHRLPQAHARVWQSWTEDGAVVCMALCACSPLPALTPCVTGAELGWRSVTEWRLLAVTQRSEPY
ncbi:4'-phosphopantetheinyl transferase family protein [Comamonas sp. UBA7528]|uniref:4'-phosphopantetheinyl transferase family protein n=1 Tax=Comamonas sp. UBA7528 TaxID=1946391 RepID=UPI0039C86D05